MLTTIAIFAIAGGSALLAAIYLAPEGYENADGFHYGEPPQDTQSNVIQQNSAVKAGGKGLNDAVHAKSTITGAEQHHA